MADNLREVRLNSELCRAAEERFRSRFPSVEELLTFVLQELLRDDSAKMGS